MKRRELLLPALCSLLAGGARAQSGPALPPSPKPFGRFAEHGALTGQLTPDERAEALLDSSAPAGPPGRWEQRASMPVPTSEFSGAAASGGRLHVAGGWIDHAEHYVYDPADDRWFGAAPLPRPGNHVPMAAVGGRVYALGGFAGPNRDPFADVYAYEADRDRWVGVAPLPRARGAGGAAVLDGRIHLVGGATSIPGERTSIAWHEAYDPAADKWTLLAPLPGARDHLGTVAYGGRLHAVGGRFNLSTFNTGLHHAYLPDADRWDARDPMPTARSGHGLVLYRERLFAMGGEGLLYAGGKPSPKVYGQTESYDPATDTWKHHAAMRTPRHGSGAAVIGDALIVAGGAPVAGGSLQAATNEAFTLAA